MQRLYSTFPLGRPGIGLLFLRAAVAILLVTHVHVHLGSLTPSYAAALAWLGALTIALGIGTAFLAILCTLMQLGAWLLWAPCDLGCGAVSLLASLALVLLGPGGYSIDAKVLGRRIVILPSRTFPPP